MTTNRKNSLLALRDKPPEPVARQVAAPVAASPAPSTKAPSREGRKAITGYFSPELSFAMHTTARRHNMSLQSAMAEAFNDWLRKMGESPIGE